MSITLSSLNTKLEVLLERLTNTTKDVEEKHTQNRRSIHEIREILQQCVDEIWKLKIKMAAYSIIGGILTVLVEQAVKNMFFKK